MKLLVIDVGGTEIKYATINETLVLEHFGYVNTPKTCLDDFVECIKEIYVKFKNDIDGVSVSLPGFIDIDTGVCIGGGPLSYNRGINVKEKLKNALGCTVHIENDAKAAIIAEHESGSLKGVENCAVFVIGTGIGGGFILNNKLIRGKRSQAGEISFLNVDVNNWNLKNSFLEANCSTTALLNRYKTLSPTHEEISGREFFNRIDKDKYVMTALKQICRNIAIQIYNFGTMLDLDKVAIGGGISRQEILIQTIKNEIDDLIMHNPLNTGTKLNFPEVCVCKYFNEANLVGAYYSYKKYHD